MPCTGLCGCSIMCVQSGRNFSIIYWPHYYNYLPPLKASTVLVVNLISIVSHSCSILRNIHLSYFVALFRQCSIYRSMHQRSILTCIQRRAKSACPLTLARPHSCPTWPGASGDCSRHGMTSVMSLRTRWSVSKMQVSP